MAELIDCPIWVTREEKNVGGQLRSLYVGHPFKMTKKPKGHKPRVLGNELKSHAHAVLINNF